MKKLLLVLISLLMLVSVNETLFARELFFGGGTTGSVYLALNEEKAIPSLGFYLKLGTQMNQNLDISISYERFISSQTENIEGTNVTRSINLNGFPVLVYYWINDYLSILGGVGYYWGKITISSSGISLGFDLNGNIGFLGGIEVKYPISKNLYLTIDGLYRLSKLSIYMFNYNQELDFSGPVFSLGIMYKF